MLDFNAFLNSLPVMLYGMLGIFVVTAIIILVVILINKLDNKNNS